MHANVQLLIFGAAAGMLYALFAAGLIIVFRSSRVLNFGYGAIALAGTYTYLDLIDSHGWPKVPAVIAGVLTSVVIGVAFDWLFMRRLRNADALARLVCTLGLLILIDALIPTVFGDQGPVPVNLLPARTWQLPFGQPHFTIGSDQVILMAITVVICLLLWALYSLTAFGRATRAMADNERAAQLVGIAPLRLELMNWALASGMAGLAGILLSTRQTPTLGSSAQTLVIAIAIALVANFQSFGVLVVVGLVLGSGQALLLRYDQSIANVTNIPGWDQALPLVVIIAAVVLGGRSVVPRGEDIKRSLPVARMPSKPWLPVSVAATVGVLWFLVAPIGVVGPTVVSLITAIALMSLVVLTGWCGQISLGQMSLAAVGALGAGRILEHVGLTPPLALLLGGLAVVPVGFIVGLPAVRVRGVNLAVVSLCVAIVLDATIFSSDKLTGASIGLSYPSAKTFGIDMNTLTRERAFGVFAVVVTLLVGGFVLLVRRSALGSRLLAVRADERGAAAQGLSVARVKLLAFVIAAFVAGISGVLMGYWSQQIAWGTFAYGTSITLVGVLYIGGVTSIGGAVVGGLLLADGGLISYLLGFSGNAQTIVNAASGIGVMAIVVLRPGGLVGLPRDVVRYLAARRRRPPDPPVSGAGRVSGPAVALAEGPAQ